MKKSVMSKALIESDISLHEFALLKNMLIEYNNIKEEIRNPKSIQIWLI